MIAPQIISASVSPASVPPSSHEFIGSSPQLSPEEASKQKYLENCASKITEQCGEEIYTSVFRNGTYTDNCCHNLVVSLGKECHDKMVKFIIFNIPEFKEKNSTILTKSEQIWNKCALVAASPSSAPSSSS